MLPLLKKTSILAGLAAAGNNQQPVLGASCPARRSDNDEFVGAADRNSGFRRVGNHRIMEPANLLRSQGKSGKTAGEAFDAVLEGDVDTLQRLLASSPEIIHEYHWGGTTLDAAAQYSESLEMLAMLLSQGANPNSKFPNDVTPLHSVSREWKKPLPAIQLLLRYGADFSPSDMSGDTPLMELKNRTLPHSSSVLASIKLLEELTAKED